MPKGFDSLPLSPSLVATTKELGYSELTPIQEKAIPVLLSGKDLIGEAKTGSGKTAAFALPILESLRLERRTLQALVLVPTRELCSQVAREFRKLGSRHAGLHVLVVAGGMPMRTQVTALRGGVHIVVGTPGRVMDLMARRVLQFYNVKTVVLDEADTMLDMGFADDMDKILGEMPHPLQTAFFSATFPGRIEDMSRRHQKDAVRVTIESSGEDAPDIRQAVLPVEEDEKLGALYRIFGEHPHESALVFCATRRKVAELATILSRAGLSTECLHGDLEQFDRDRVMAMFRNQSVRVLVATDVAARGIDVADLELVVNYDLPSRPDVYIHRIGRTGRAGKAGLSVSFVTPQEDYKLASIEQRIGAPLELMRRHLDGYQDIHSLTQNVQRGSKMDTIAIAGGRKDKVRPGDILGALTGEAGGLQGSDIGKIEIHDRHAYVAVATAFSRDAVKSLNNGRIKGRRFNAELVQRFQG